MAARTEAGLTPVGEHFPRRATLRRIGVPSAVLAGLAVAVGLVAVVTERDVLALSALGLLIVLTAVGGATLGWALDDPLRISSADRAVIDAASRWTPGRSPVAPGPARALVAVASSTAQRVVDSPAWRSGVLARGGIAVPLGTELDLAEQRAAGARNEDWARLVTRVAALVAYADAVTTLDVNDGELDAADVEVLAFLLSAAIYSVG